MVSLGVLLLLLAVAAGAFAADTPSDPLFMNQREGMLARKGVAWQVQGQSAKMGGQNMTLPQSVFGGLALIAIAIYVGQATNTADAQDQPKPTPEIRFQLMAPFGYEAAGYVFRVDPHTAQVSLCAARLNNLKDAPQCTPWSNKEVMP